MEATKFIWMDGKQVPWEESVVHSLTHTFHYGGGAFEGVRFYETEKGPAIFKLQEHVDRLFYSGGVIGMNVPFSNKEIHDAIVKTVKGNEVSSGYIRPMFYYGFGMGLNPKNLDVHAMIACWPWGAYLGGDKPVKVQISKYIRIHPKSTVADAKLNGHYANSILASLEMNEVGKDEALFLDFNGNVAEGPGENFFMVKDGKVITPKLGTILGGITRATIMEMLQDDMKVEVEERDIKPEELYDADELFFTGTAAEVSPIGEIDGHVINENEVGVITKEVRDRYMDIVHGRDEKYNDTLTYINN